jgi:hypothetical protein
MRSEAESSSATHDDPGCGTRPCTGDPPGHIARLRHSPAVQRSTEPRQPGGESVQVDQVDEVQRTPTLELEVWRVREAARPTDRDAERIGTPARTDEDFRNIPRRRTEFSERGARRLFNCVAPLTSERLYW